MPKYFLTDAGENLAVEFKSLRKMNCPNLQHLEALNEAGFQWGTKFCNTGRLRPMVEFHGKRLSNFLNLRLLQDSEIQWVVKMESPCILTRAAVDSYLLYRVSYLKYMVQTKVAEAMLRKYP